MGTAYSCRCHQDRAHGDLKTRRGSDEARFSQRVAPVCADAAMPPMRHPKSMLYSRVGGASPPLDHAQTAQVSIPTPGSRTPRHCCIRIKFFQTAHARGFSHPNPRSARPQVHCLLTRSCSACAACPKSSSQCGTAGKCQLSMCDAARATGHRACSRQAVRKRTHYAHTSADTIRTHNTRDFIA